MATPEQIAATLRKYEAARDKILETGQSYRIGDREFTRADLRFLEEQIERLEQRLDSVTTGSGNGGKFKYASAVFRGRS